MKAVLVFVCALCVLASAYPRAAREEEEESKEDDTRDTELYIVPLERSQRPVFGFGLPQDLVPPPFEQHPFFRTNPWADIAPAGAGGEEHVGDFMTQMQEMLREMQKQLTDLLQRPHHTLPDGNTSVVDTRISDEDLPQNKSTSTTKVIDGHVVTVNETTYSSGDDNIGAVFRIKVVEVKPSETPEGEETPSEVEGTPSEGEEIPSQEPTSSEETREHEPTTSKSELEEDKHDETNEIPNQKVREEWSEWDSETDPSLNEIDQPEVFSIDEFPLVKKENYYDLSGDTKVNDYLSDQAESQGLVMIDPDAEVIDSNQYYHYGRVPQKLQRLTL